MTDFTLGPATFYLYFALVQTSPEFVSVVTSVSLSVFFAVEWFTNAFPNTHV